MRLIDADALARRTIGEKRFVFSRHDLLTDEFIFRTVYKDLGEFIENAPTIDAVPVVRCAECKHWYGEEGVCLKIYSDGSVSPYAWQFRSEDDFCSCGERISDDL